jgi:hypothetical protein
MIAILIIKIGFLKTDAGVCIALLKQRRSWCRGACMLDVSLKQYLRLARLFRQWLHEQLVIRGQFGDIWLVFPFDYWF